MKTTFSIKDLIPILSLIISISLPLGYAYMMKMNELVIYRIVFGYKSILSIYSLLIPQSVIHILVIEQTSLTMNKLLIMPIVINIQ